MEFLDILALYNCLRAITTSRDELIEAKARAPQGLVPLLDFLGFRPPQFSADSLKTIVVSWFALFIDKNGMDAIKLWCEVFPQHAAKTKAAWRRMEPEWQAIRDFRNRAGFHADKPPKFFEARRKFLQEWPKVEVALGEFDTLFKFFLKAETTELAAELEPALDSLLDDLEHQHGTKFQREQFKSYLMIADSKAAAPTLIQVKPR